ncbi:lysozyme inhibitor LprI family protein [Paenirhodobacter populi]|uniref:lysozyme inhibitor LprI family protein n=1 Tax=Paenirhodobacter populi TaxID=2306993 RepID=UPI0019D48A40|nr:lysozyme inhibitor LprI family protein [Sinirhodobacter populi]
MIGRAALAVLLVAPLPALAQADCSNATQQVEMNACAAAAYTQADEALNAIYKQAVAAAKGQGDDGPKLLLAAQRAWIAYRDAACAAEVAPYAGGSIQPLVQAQCLERLTRARSEDLRAAYLSN